MLPNAVWAVVFPNGTLDSAEWLWTSLKNIATPSFLKNPPNIFFVIIRSIDCWLETACCCSNAASFLWGNWVELWAPLPFSFPRVWNLVTSYQSSLAQQPLYSWVVGEYSLGLVSFLKPTAWVTVMRALRSLRGNPRLNKWACGKSWVPRSGGEPRSAMCLPIFIEINCSVRVICSSGEYSFRPPPHPFKPCSEEPVFYGAVRGNSRVLSQMLFLWGVWEPSP